MDLRGRVSAELLPFVEQPGQYIGHEFNQLVREGDWERAEIRIATVFPDTYTLGMSHLGCQIIYWLCNHTPGVCSERVYAPWIDAERVMRRAKLPLFTWDTRRPVATADILAVSLQYEMVFTNLLTVLDLSGIPLYARDRDDSHPLVICGGPQADNPEPVADFVDLVVIGDGEESMAAIIEAYRELKAAGVRRREMIPEMARRFEWIYAPSLYDPSYHADGTLAALRPTIEGLRTNIARCQTPEFDEAPFPVRPIVPFVQVIHDRVSVEIMRGCPERCRFCHAGYTKRPLRWRPVEKVLELAEQALEATGQKELGLLSLSTADYPKLRELSEAANARFGPRKINISMPSLRVDRMLANIPFMVNSVRKSGLTIAVEAARDEMRAAIRKKVTDGNLMDGVLAAYKAGWRSVKLYYMCGFPGEGPADIDGIWDLSVQVSKARRQLGLAPASVNASVGWLVPKPFTPFQWAPQRRAEDFHAVRRRLRELSRSMRSAVHVKTHNVERSILEGVFARGDRRLAPAIERAWRLGARFDGWDETFSAAIWERAFAETGIDPAWYTHRERPYGELLPWAHIGSGPSTPYLEHQYDDVFVKLGQAGPGAQLQTAGA